MRPHLGLPVTASAVSVEAGATVRLTATVTGDPADNGTIKWSAPVGTFSSTSGTETSWTAPAAAGTVTVTAELTVTATVTGSGADEAVIDWTADRGTLSVPAGATTTWTAPATAGTASITGLRVNGSAHYAGIFGNIGATGEVSDLTVVDAMITGYRYVGSLAGQSAGRIRNVSNQMTAEDSAQVKGLRGDTGGLVGANLGVIEDSWSAVPVTAGGAGSGGLVGSNGAQNDGSGVITRSRAASPLVHNRDHNSAGNSGGLVGTNFGTVIDSYSHSNLLSTEPNTGGLVGYNQVDGLIERSWTGSGVQASGTYNVGGLVGMNWGTIEQSYSLAAEAKATINRARGLVGHHRSTASIIETYSLTKVTAPANRGGLIGEHESGGAVQRSFWDMEGSGALSSPGGPGAIGRASTAQMYERASYEPHGWDFTAVWHVDEGDDTPDLISNPR